MEWTELVRGFSEVGFAGVTGFLLWERFRLTKWLSGRQDARDDKLADALTEFTVATQRLSDMCQGVKEAMIGLQQEVRLSKVNGKRR